MGFLIDTNIFIKWERHDPVIEGFFMEMEAEGKAEYYGLSVITEAELLHAVHRANTEQKRKNREAFVESIFKQFTLYPFDSEAARVYAETWAKLQKEGVNIGMHDMQIAATAISEDLTILTSDKKDFSRIPDLQVKFL